MKRKTIILAVVAAAAMALTLSHPCTVHKADRYKLCSVHKWDPYTDYVIVNIKTGEVLVDRVHDRTFPHHVVVIAQTQICDKEAVP